MKNLVLTLKQSLSVYKRCFFKGFNVLFDIIKNGMVNVPMKIISHFSYR